MKTLISKTRMTALAVLGLLLLLAIQGHAQSTCCNLLTNGDFETSGGFTSGLPANCECIGTSYCVGPNFQAKCGGWPNLTDHTSGSGKFLIIDGSEDAAVDVWKSTVQVNSNTTYCLSFWVASVYDSPFDLGLTVNNVLVPGATFTVQQGVPSWTQYTFSFTGVSGSSIAIRQLAGGAFQDFGLDDIEFGAPITPAFVSSPDISCGTNVSFFSQSTGPAPLTYMWTFGDPNSGAANTSTQQNPTHKFTACGSYEVCLKVSKGGCNQTICQTLLVEDSESPVITCPTNQTILAVLPVCSTIINGLSPLSVHDNCEMTTVNYTVTGASSNTGQNDASGITYQKGTSIVTYTAVDKCGNESSCSFALTVVCDSSHCNCTPNNFSPQFPTAGPNLVVNGNFSAGNTGFSNQYAFFTPGSTTGAGKYSVLNGAQVPLANPNWVCSDPSGSVTGKFLVCDGASPAGQIVWSQTIAVTQGEPYSFCFSINNLQLPTLNLDDPLIQVFINGFSIIGPLPFGENPNAWIPVIATWQATSASANIEIRAVSASSNGNDFAIDDIKFNKCSASCQASFEFQPIGGCGNFQFTSSSAGPLPLSYSWNFEDGGTSTAANPSHSFPGCGSYNVCLTITGNGCSSTICHSIIVTESVAPILNCPPNTVVACSNAIPPSATGIATATDNCSIPTLTYSDVVLGIIPCNPVIIRTWKAVDACGNISTCGQSITVNDNILPTVICPANTTVNTNPGQCYFTGTLPAATANDNCDQASVITCSLFNGTNFVPVTPNTQYPKGNNTIRCQATDECGNVGLTCTYTLTVRDNQPPTITCPASTTVTGTLSQGICKAIVNGLAPTVGDNCPMTTVAYNINGTTTGSGANDASGTNFMAGVSTVTYTATDMGGNTATCSFKVTVNCPPQEKLFKCGMAITTAYSLIHAGKKVVTVRDIRNPLGSGAVLQQHWAAPVITNNDWTVYRMGEVFGIAIDKDFNVYVAATSMYGTSSPSGLTFGSAGSGGIYKLDAYTGNVTDFVTTNPSPTANTVGTATLPNFKSGLGNICYDEAHLQFFVTNLEDGKIYRIAAPGNANPPGQVLSKYDPFTLDNNSPTGAACFGELIWGVGVLNGRVFFSLSNQSNTQLAVPNKVYSIGLDASGNFLGGSPTLEVTIPNLPGSTGSNPVTDIEFSGGTMLLAEHSISIQGNTVCSSYSPGAHNSRVLEYAGFSGSWAAVPKTIYIGGYNTSYNAAGGCDYGYASFNPANSAPTGCNSTVWATGDALRLDAGYIYGLAGIPATGNGPTLPTNNYTPLNSWFVDWDNDLTMVDKTRMGDVDIFHCSCQNPSAGACDAISVVSTASTLSTDSCCFKLAITNSKPNYFTGIAICASGGVSISSVSGLSGWTIQQFGATMDYLEPSTTFVTVGSQDFLKFCLSNYANVPNQTVIVKYYGPDGTVVCSDTLHYNCSQKPKCLKIVNENVTCGPNGTYKLDFCIMSNSLIGWNLSNFVLNAPPNSNIHFTPNNFPVAGPLVPGATRCTFSTIISGAVDGQKLCFSISGHNLDSVSCCTDTVALACVTMPSCICSHLSATAEAVDIPGKVCCWKINLANSYSNNYFTGVEVNIATLGVVFGTVVNPINPNGWMLSGNLLNQAIFKKKPLGSFIGATATLPTFCLSGILTNAQKPQTLILHWLSANGDTGCSDTLILDCTPPVVDSCAEVLNFKVECDTILGPGHYNISFQVYNHTGFNVDQVTLSPGGPFTQNVFAANIPNLTTSTTFHGQLYSTAGQPVCFNLQLHLLGPNGELFDCCTNPKPFCFTPPDCSDSCTCQGFSPLSFYNSCWSKGIIPAACGQTLTLPCLKPGQKSLFYFHGNLNCSAPECMQDSVHWTIVKMPSGALVANGASHLKPLNPTSPGGHFDINLQPTAFTPGVQYMLVVNGRCGTQICTCKVTFTFESCPCPCDLVDKDAKMGFKVLGIVSTGCQKTFMPIALCPNDVVTWVVDGIPEQVTTLGNAVRTITFPSSGLYQVSIKVMRTGINGMICEGNHCQKVLVQGCSGGMNPKFCQDGVINNGDFNAGGIVLGHLGYEAALPGWKLFPNVGDGFVMVDDSSGGSDAGHIILNGGKDNFAGIYQDIVNLGFSNQDSFVVIEYYVRNYSGADMSAGTVLEFRLQSDSLPGNATTAQIIRREPVIADSVAWQKHTISVRMHPEEANRFLVVCLQSNDANIRSMVGIDDIEICASDTTPVPATSATTQPKQLLPIRIFPNPNPGTFNVQLPESARKGMSFRIVALTGQMLREMATQPGASLQTVQSGDLPPGLYFLELIADGRILAIEKFVKQ